MRLRWRRPSLKRLARLAGLVLVVAGLYRVLGAERVEQAFSRETLREEAAEVRELMGAGDAEVTLMTRELAGRYLSDDPDAPLRLDPRKARRLYDDLLRDPVMRARSYAMSDEVIFKALQRPGKPDGVPSLSNAERTALLEVLQPGDIITCGNDGSFVHAAFYAGDGRIVHALGQAGFGRRLIGVREEPLLAYLDRDPRDMVVVLRPPWNADGLGQATSFARSQVGKPYDSLFLTDADDRFYCTELCYKLLTRTRTARVDLHTGDGAVPVVVNEDFRQSKDLRVVYRLRHD